MANWRTRFPSRFLQAADLDAGPIDATIKTIGDELIGTGDQATHKPVVYFREKHVKPCVLNQTRSEAIAAIAGSDDDDDWVGVRIRLQKGRTKFQGRSVACIDIVAPSEPAVKRPPAKKATTAAPEPDDPLPGDEEPF